MMIINMRKHLDRASVREDFRSIKSIADCQKIYIICNDDTVGQVTLINELHKHWSSKLHRKQQKRNGAVAIRLVAACSKEDHRGFMVRYLSARKNCMEQDQSNNTTVGGFDIILDSFNDSSLPIERPPEMDLENVDPNKSIDPSSVSAPGLEDDAQWLESVWTEYVRPKYKLILQKWYKDTGGVQELWRTSLIIAS